MAETTETTPETKSAPAATRPVHIALIEVKLSEKEAAKRGAPLGATIAHLIRYALARKAALARYGASAKGKKTARKSAAKRGRGK